MVDPQDRRLVEMLRAVDIAPTLRVDLLDPAGRRISVDRAEEEATGGTTIAPVTGTPWQLQVADVGPDPRAPIAAFRRESLWLAPTLAALATLLGWGIARSVRQPLIRLTAAAERIARGNLERPIDVRRAARGGGEVARLAAALEEMRTALRTSINDIEEANRELERRVEARTRELAAANASLEERERLRQRLLRQVISAQEDERRRVARELHDETSQSLAALGIDLEMALGSSGAEAQRRMDDARKIVSRMHQGLHRLIVNLRPSVLDDLGLAAAIRWVAERELAGLNVRCELTDLDERLPSEIETAVFRAVQESIVNIARHAQAESVLIQGAIENGRLVVEIEDDGCGFDPAGIVRTPDSMRGIGLLGMRERVEILGGHVTVDSAPGEGTRIVLDVPVAAGVGAGPQG
jgi:signal transduction histidine kinase